MKKKSSLRSKRKGKKKTMSNNKSVSLYPESEPFIKYGEDEKKPEVMKTYKVGKDGKWEFDKEITTTHTSGTKKVFCQHGPAWGFSSKLGTHFFGAASYDADPLPYDLAFDIGRTGEKTTGDFPAIAASKRSNSGIVLQAPEHFSKLNSLLRKPTPIVDILWPDFGVPLAAGFDFWTEIADVIDEHYKGASVLVSCTGGHGRTGTFLAILNALLNDRGAEQSINDIRTQYCSRAIETKAQEQYIADIVSGAW